MMLHNLQELVTEQTSWLLLADSTWRTTADTVVMAVQVRMHRDTFRCVIN